MKENYAVNSILTECRIQHPSVVSNTSFFYSSFILNKTIKSLKRNNSFLTLIIALAVFAFNAESANGQTTVVLSASEDTYLFQQTPGNNNGTCVNILVDGYGTLGRVSRGMLKFDLSSIPADASITSATLGLQFLSGFGTPTAQVIDINRITNTWSEGTNCVSNGSPNWTSFGSNSNFDATASASTTITSIGAYTWNLQSLVQNWVNGTYSNNGVIIKFDTESNGSKLEKAFGSSDNATPSYRPTLTVTYNSNSTTISVRVNQSSDDAEEAGSDATGSHPPGFMDLTSSDIELTTDNDATGGYSGGMQKIGMRFRSINIPQGAIITDAYIVFRAIDPDAPNTNSGATSLTIKGQAADNPSTFTSTSYDITGRTTTSASVVWSPSSWTTGTNYNSPALTTIAQEIVNRSGWASGNSMVFIVTGTGSRTTDSYNGNSATAPQLVITYTVPSPGGVSSGNTLWLKADAGTSTTTDGATVTTWSDQSIYGYHATTTSNTGTNWTNPGANPPAYQSGANTNAVNFNPTVNFAAARSLDGAGGMASHQVFTVYKNATSPGVAILGYDDPSGNGGSGQGTLWHDPTFIIQAFRNTSNGNNIQMTRIYSFGSPSVATVLDAQHISTVSGSFWINGDGGTPTVTPSGTSPSPFASPGKYRLGKASTNNFASSPVVAEVISYARNLSTTERERVNAYLGIKYGITLGHNYLDADGNVIWDRTTNAGYNNNIAGMARNDESSLYQKQSRSINSGLQLVIGNGNTIATSNPGNSSIFTSDKSSMIWGNNTGSVATWTTTGAPVTRKKIDRNWRIQETGTVGSVKIQVADNSGTNGLPMEETTVYLLLDADGNFAAGATEIAMTLNGTNWEADVDFTNGLYFSFATEGCEAKAPVLTKK